MKVYSLISFLYADSEAIYAMLNAVWIRATSCVIASCTCWLAGTSGKRTSCPQTSSNSNTFLIPAGLPSANNDSEIYDNDKNNQSNNNSSNVFKNIEDYETVISSLDECKYRIDGIAEKTKYLEKTLDLTVTLKFHVYFFDVSLRYAYTETFCHICHSCSVPY